MWLSLPLRPFFPYYFECINHLKEQMNMERPYPKEQITDKAEKLLQLGHVLVRMRLQA